MHKALHPHSTERIIPLTAGFAATALGLATMVVPCVASADVSWEEIQDVKRESLQIAAQHAMEQQKRTAGEPVALAFPQDMQTGGSLEARRQDDDTVVIRVEASPTDFKTMGDDTLRIELPAPVNMLENHSGLAMTVSVDEAHPEVRWGVRLIGSNGETMDILPRVPVKNSWGTNPHEIYFDWAFLDYADVEDAIAVLESVEALEFAAASAKRVPNPGPSDAARSAEFTLSDLRLVDYLKGSYDPNRHSWGWEGKDEKDLTLQHRTQEISGVVAQFGGDEGLKSAVESLDMTVRTQMWDGSFLDRRRGPTTVASGEYTHGFTLWGLMNAYEHFEDIDLPALDEPLTVGPETMTRRDFYQRMLYRGARSRASYPPSEYRDDIIRQNVLVIGANRVLGYAIAMRRAADLLQDPEQAQEVLEAYKPIMQELSDAQGEFSGGFPILGEGDRFEGQGIHYDAGYMRTHMDWLVIGINATGEPLLVDMLRRYQEVVEAVMNQEGTGIMRLLSERGRSGGDVRLVLPDVTAQVGLDYNLPAIAQWGYNVGMPTWAKWEPGARLNHFTAARTMRGYSLGAHVNILLADINEEPEPRDIGYRFPRQFPIWSSRFYQKDDGRLTRTSRVHIAPDGTMTNDFRIEVGEYLETIGVPVLIRGADVTISAEAVALEGWPTLLKDDAKLRIEGAVEPARAKVNEAVELRLAPGRNRIVITGPKVKLPEEAGGASVPFRAVLILTHQGEEETPVTLRVLNETPEYEHAMPHYPQR